VVVEVIDGDTIVVDVGGREEHVRLIGIDTPEVYVDAGEPECYGPEASAFTKSLLPPGTAVRLERDVVGRDDYGRLLAYVYVADGSADEQLVNETIVAGGFATPLSIAPNVAFAQRFAAAARTAEATGLGLWDACAG
jgi:micrococcal nuclease